MKQSTRRLYKKLCLPLVLCPLLLLFLIPSSNFYESAQFNTVLVDVPDGWGTGFAIRRTNPNGNPRLFVWTARHVVHGISDVSAIVYVRDSEHKRISTIRLSVKRVWETSADAALLWLDCPAGLFTGGLEFDTKLPALGQPVFAVGNGDGPVYDGIVTSGIVSQFGIPQNSEHGISWEVTDATTAELNSGVSGGAVFSERTHKVIGIAVGSTHHGMNVYLPTREILKAARESKIEWAVFGNSCPADSELIPKPTRSIWNILFGL